MTVTQADRDAAANAVQAYRDQKNGNWQQRIRDGQCDDGEMVQAFARHRLAHTAGEPASDLVEAATEALRQIDKYAEFFCDEDFDPTVDLLRAALAKPTSKGPNVTDKTTLTDGSPVTPDHRETITEGPRKGQQKAYVVLSAEERAKGFVRPVRRSYVHEKCGVVTTMGQALAETYARDPYFYNGTFCCGCGTHFPVGEDGQFVWDGTNEKVGT